METATDPKNGTKQPPKSKAKTKADRVDSTKVVFTARELFFSVSLCENLPPEDRSEARAAGESSDTMCEGAGWDYLHMAEKKGLVAYVPEEKQRSKLYSVKLTPNQARTVKARLERAVDLSGPDNLNISSRLCNEYLDIAERLGSFIDKYPKTK